MNLAKLEKEWEKTLISHCENTKEDVKEAKRLIAEGTTAYSLFVEDNQKTQETQNARH